MVGNRQLHAFVFFIMATITVLNMGLAVNFVTASGQALAAAFNSESIFLFAGAELLAVLLAYVFYKHKTNPTKS